MSRKKNSDDIPYTFVSLTSRLQHPSLEIDLKTFYSKSSSSKHENKRKSSRSGANSVVSDSNYNDNDTSSILRPIKVESLTPTIAKSYKNYSNSYSWEETPIKQSKRRPNSINKSVLTQEEMTKAQSRYEDSYNNESVHMKECNNDDIHISGHISEIFYPSENRREKNSSSQLNNERDQNSENMRLSDHNSEMMYASVHRKSENSISDFKIEKKPKNENTHVSSHNSQIIHDSDHRKEKNSVNDFNNEKIQNNGDICVNNHDSEKIHNSNHNNKRGKIPNEFNNEKIQNKNVIIEEEEEENSAYSDISEEFVDKQSINYLNKLINKIKDKSQDTKNYSINSLSSRYQTHDSTAKSNSKSQSQTNPKAYERPVHTNSKDYIQKEIAEKSSQKMITLKNKCYELNKYLEENGYNDLENDSDQKLTDEFDENYSRNIPKNRLTKQSKHRNYTVAKENFQICDVRESDYEFEQQDPQGMNFQHFFIFNVDNPQTNESISKIPNEKSITRSVSNDIKNDKQITKEDEEKVDSIAYNNNTDDSCSIPFSDSSSNSKFTSPSRNYGQRRLHSPHLSPRLQKMKENSSSRGTSPETKKLRDKAIGNLNLSMKDMSVWCQIEDEEEDELNDHFDVEFEVKNQAKTQRQATPSRNNTIKSRTLRVTRKEKGNRRIRKKTLDKNENNLTDERQNKSCIRENKKNSFSRLNSNSLKPNNERSIMNINNKDNILDNNNIKAPQKTVTKPPIYAEHRTQTEDVSNEDEL